MGPGRNKSGHAVGPRRVGVGVCCDVDAFGARGVYFRDDLRHAAPILFACDLQMPNFDRDMRLASDAQRFVNGGQNGVALVAHVRGIDAAGCGSLLRQSNQFFGPGVRRGRVFERSGDADGAVAHGLAHEFLHLLELRGSGLNVVGAENHGAHLRGADVGSDVDASMLFFKTREVLAESAPVGSDAVVVEGFVPVANERIVQRRCGAAFAGDLGGDALKDFRWQARIDENSELGLAEHVDESGSDNHAVSIDGARALSGGEIADSGDPAITNPDVAGIPGGARAVNDAAVGDDDVVGRGRLFLSAGELRESIKRK